MKKMLLIVDPQNDFINGALAVAGAEKAMKGLADYVAKNAGTYDYIAVTCDNHPQNHCSFKANGGEWPPHCVIDSHGAEIWPPLASAISGAQAEVLAKGQDPALEEYSIFRNPHGRLRLIEQIEKQGIGHIDICGIAGDYCVLQTLRDGVEIFGADKFAVLAEFTPSIDGGHALNEYLRGLGE